MNRYPLLAALVVACTQQPQQQPSPDRASVRPTPPTAPEQPTSRVDTGVEQALVVAWPDPPLDHAGFERLAATLQQTHTAAEHGAWLFAAARRAPPSEIARVTALATADDADTLARALAGRPTDHPISELPRALGDSLSRAHPAPAAAAVVSRFRLRAPGHPDVQRLLTSSAVEDQIAGARLLAARDVPAPDPAVYELVDPALVPAIVRSLATRVDTADPVWIRLLTLLAERARLAPRRWGNAWRAARSAVPTSRPSILPALQAAIESANQTTALPSATLAWFRCENAVALDRLAGAWPRGTLGCATEGNAWIAGVSQAEVLGSSPDQPGRRADALAHLVNTAQGHPRVLEAAAAAATALPPAASGAVVRRIARERDPGVEAALLEALVAHPQHATALPEALRHELLAAPFEQPEGPTLEARVQAIQLARILHAEPAARPTAGSVRAIELALAPDAAVPALHLPVPAPLPPRATLRVETEAGAFEIALEPSTAPRAVGTLLAAVRARRYDGLDFHRVVPGFVAQGGDPRGDGYGGTDQPTLTELSLRPFERGAVGVPLAGLDTGGIQFFVVLADAPHLDGRYPWLGRVTRGIEVVDGLLPGDRILSVTVVEPG